MTTQQVGNYPLDGGIINCVYQQVPTNKKSDRDFLAFIFAVMVKESAGFANARLCVLHTSLGDVGGNRPEDWPPECFQYAESAIPSFLCNPNNLSWLEDSVGLFQLLRCVGQGGGQTVSALENPSINASIAMPPLVNGWDNADDSTLESKVRDAAALSGHPGDINRNDPRITGIWLEFLEMRPWFFSHSLPLTSDEGCRDAGSDVVTFGVARPYGVPPITLPGANESPLGTPPRVGSNIGMHPYTGDPAEWPSVPPWGGPAPSVPSSGPLICPTTGALTTPFSSGHPALDISSTSGFGCGADVVASHAGIVLFSGMDPNTSAACPSNPVNCSRGYGWQVSLFDGERTFTRYAHFCQPPVVRTGQIVLQGTVLGKQGATGRATGTHLHFELIIRQDNGQLTYIDPVGIGGGCP